MRLSEGPLAHHDNRRALLFQCELKRLLDENEKEESVRQRKGRVQEFPETDGRWRREILSLPCISKQNARQASAMAVPSLATGEQHTVIHSKSNCQLCL